MRGDAAVQVRPATVEDAKGIAAVRARNGMPSFDIEDWRQSWESHPFRDEFAETPFGWVLENGREGIVGTLSNIPMMYDLDGKPVRASASGAWAVDSPHRRSSLLLMSALLRQKGVDLHIIGSANTVASPIMTGLKLPRIPAPDFNVSLLWVTGYRGFATSVLRKKNIPAASWLGMPAGAALGAYDCLKGRVGRRRVEVRQYDSFTEDFDIFWNELRRRPDFGRAAVALPAIAANGQTRHTRVDGFAGSPFRLLHRAGATTGAHRPETVPGSRPPESGRRARYLAGVTRSSHRSQPKAWHPSGGVARWQSCQTLCSAFSPAAPLPLSFLAGFLQAVPRGPWRCSGERSYLGLAADRRILSRWMFLS